MLPRILFFGRYFGGWILVCLVCFVRLWLGRPFWGDRFVTHQLLLFSGGTECYRRCAILVSIMLSSKSYSKNTYSVSHLSAESMHAPLSSLPCHGILEMTTYVYVTCMCGGCLWLEIKSMSYNISSCEIIQVLRGL